MVQIYPVRELHIEPQLRKETNNRERVHSCHKVHTMHSVYHSRSLVWVERLTLWIVWQLVYQASIAPGLRLSPTVRWLWSRGPLKSPCSGERNCLLPRASWSWCLWLHWQLSAELSRASLQHCTGERDRKIRRNVCKSRTAFTLMLCKLLLHDRMFCDCKLNIYVYYLWDSLILLYKYL